MNNKKCTAQQLRNYRYQLQSIFNNVSKQYLTFQEMYLICYESNIRFHAVQEQEKLKNIFSMNGGTLQFPNCFRILSLLYSKVVHNKLIFYVQVTIQAHQSSECFSFWKRFMTNKFGSQMKWFDLISNQIQCRRLKSYLFKQNLKKLLKGTQHQNCSDNICSRFPKNAKNQIEWSTFMQVIRHIQNKYESSHHRQQSIKQFVQNNSQNFYSFSNQQEYNKIMSQGQVKKSLNNMKRKRKIKMFNVKQNNSKQMDTESFWSKSYGKMTSSQINKTHQKIIKKFSTPQIQQARNYKIRSSSANLNKKIKHSIIQYKQAKTSAIQDYLKKGRPASTHCTFSHSLQDDSKMNQTRNQKRKRIYTQQCNSFFG